MQHDQIVDEVNSIMLRCPCSWKKILPEVHGKQGEEDNSSRHQQERNTQNEQHA